MTWQEQDLDESQAKYYGERDGGNYGWSTKAWQLKTYNAKKEAEAKREELFEAALSKFKKGDIEGVRPLQHPLPAAGLRPTAQYSLVSG